MGLVIGARVQVNVNDDFGDVTEIRGAPFHRAPLGSAAQALCIAGSPVQRQINDVRNEQRVVSEISRRDDLQIDEQAQCIRRWQLQIVIELSVSVQLQLLMFLLSEKHCLN